MKRRFTITISDVLTIRGATLVEADIEETAAIRSLVEAMWRDGSDFRRELNGQLGTFIARATMDEIHLHFPGARV